MINGNRKEASEIVTISLPGFLAKEAERIAKENRVARSFLFQEALKEYFWLKKWRGFQAYGVKRAIDLG